MRPDTAPDTDPDPPTTSTLARRLAFARALTALALTPRLPFTRPSRALAAILTLAACRPAPTLDLPICPALVAADRATEADTRQLPAHVWLGILVPGFDRATWTLPDAPRDCARTPLVPPEGALPPRPATPDDLAFGTAGPDELLVWAQIFKRADGTAAGPVALVRWTDRGLEVRGIGPLHAPARRVRLRLEPLGPDRRLLVAEGEACPEGQAPPCPREAVLMPLTGQRLLAAELVEGARPPRPARLRLDERRDYTDHGQPRRLEIHRRLDLRGPSPEIRATIRLRDCPSPDACKDSLALDDIRPLELDGHTFVTPDDPWLSILHTHVETTS